MSRQAGHGPILAEPATPFKGDNLLPLTSDQHLSSRVFTATNSAHMAWQGRPNRKQQQPRPTRGFRSEKPALEKNTTPAPHAAHKDTSWEKSADWYDRIIGEKGSELYRAVVLPKALDLLAPRPAERVLDLGCGQGVFSRALAGRGCEVTGADLSASLIAKAKAYPSRRPVRFVVRDAAQLEGLGGDFDAISAILCVQNMEHLADVCRATAGVLRPGGRMLWVVNHPAFRIPRQSAWGHDEGRKIQYRRVDRYASALSIPIVMHPGQRESEETVSFHRSLGDLTACAFQAGLMLSGLEEWISEKQSQPGPRARAENRARQEFPLFMALLWRKPGP
jgi:2-polyprenyl-3-methyl-5-hydroxy-6-metoxy-1,4-benzoquinol methylase